MTVESRGADTGNMWGEFGSADWVRNDVVAGPAGLGEMTVYLSAGNGVIGADDRANYATRPAGDMAQGEAIEDDAVNLNQDNLEAYQSFRNEVTDHLVPAWRLVHHVPEVQHPSDADQALQQPSKGSHSRATALHEYHKAKKTPAIAWVLWVLLGDFGGHRYYLGDYPQGALMTVAGLLAWVPGMLWALIDAFNVNRRLREVNYALWSMIASKHGVALEPLPEGTYK